MSVIRASMIAIAVTAATAAPLFAQEGGANARGYVTGLGGFAASVANTTGDVSAEAGVRIAPHVMVFGTIGRFRNLQADLQPTLDTTTASLAANQGLAVIGGGSLPATYFGGGVRVEVPTPGRVMPYVLGGVSIARLSPAAQFTFSSGVLPDGSTPAVGADVTSAIISAGSFVAPPARSRCSRQPPLPTERCRTAAASLTPGIATLESPRILRSAPQRSQRTG